MIYFKSTIGISLVRSNYKRKLLHFTDNNYASIFASESGGQQSKLP